MEKFFGKTAKDVVTEASIHPFGKSPGRYLCLCTYKGQTYALRIAASPLDAMFNWVGYEFVNPISHDFSILGSSTSELTAHLAAQVELDEKQTGEKLQGLSDHYLAFVKATWDKTNHVPEHSPMAA